MLVLNQLLDDFSDGPWLRKVKGIHLWSDSNPGSNSLDQLRGAVVTSLHKTLTDRFDDPEGIIPASSVVNLATWPQKLENDKGTTLTMEVIIQFK